MSGDLARAAESFVVGCSAGKLIENRAALWTNFKELKSCLAQKYARAPDPSHAAENRDRSVGAFHRHDETLAAIWQAEAGCDTHPRSRKILHFSQRALYFLTDHAAMPTQLSAALSLLFRKVVGVTEEAHVLFSVSGTILALTTFVEGWFWQALRVYSL